MKTPEEILRGYKCKLETARINKSKNKEVADLTFEEVLLIKALMHPTDKKESKALTRAVINYLCDIGICTSEQIYTDLRCADKSVLKRLRKFRQLGLIRRESKKYYMPTPRMLQLKEKYIERVCG